MNKTKRIICISLCILLIALSLAGVIWALYSKFSKQEAHADYADLAGTDTLVNFNQLIPQTKINGSGSPIWTSIYSRSDFVMYRTHKYYIRVNNTGSYDFVIATGDAWTEFIAILTANSSNNNEAIVQIAHDASGLQIYSEYNLTYKNFNLIDLTQMFGAGNEPNLQEAQEYFTAEYYNYTAGITIPYGLDYLEGYQKGIQDFQNSLTATFNNDILGTLSFAANIAGFNNSNIAYDANLSRYLVEGLAGFRLGNSISSPINFHADLFLTNYSGGLYLAIFNYTDNGTLTPLWVGEVQTGTNLAYIDANFNIVNIDTLYFGLFDKNNEFNTYTSVSAYFVSTELKIYNIDVAALVNSAIGQTKSAYMEGGAEYEAIYQKGYLRGIAEQNATIGTMDYIGAAFTGIGSILAIELLPGVPFSLFVLLPLMFGLIAFVVKLSKGGG